MNDTDSQFTVKRYTRYTKTPENISRDDEQQQTNTS